MENIFDKNYSKEFLSKQLRKGFFKMILMEKFLQGYLMKIFIQNCENIGIKTLKPTIK